MKGAPCVVSVAEHAGWAHVICVAASGLVPVVIARRRVTLIDPGLMARRRCARVSPIFSNALRAEAKFATISVANPTIGAAMLIATRSRGLIGGGWVVSHCGSIRVSG